jgi:hypothetical protein
MESKGVIARMRRKMIASAGGRSEPEDDCRSHLYIFGADSGRREANDLIPGNSAAGD